MDYDDNHDLYLRSPMNKFTPMRVRRVQEVEIDGLEQILIEARENSRKSLALICRKLALLLFTGTSSYQVSKTQYQSKP